jgi:hypothetical protein
MNDAIAFSWRLLQSTSLGDARRFVLEMEKEPQSSAVLLDTGTALFAETAALIISGAASVGYLASQIQNVACRGRRPGLVIDARHDPLAIVEVPDLPGGTVITFAADGTQATYNACADSLDLKAVLTLLRP